MLFLLVFLVGLWPSCTLAALATQPEQVHLSLGANPTQMMVTWVTQNITLQPTVEYGLMSNFNKKGNRFHLTEKGTTTQFQDGGAKKRIFYNHRVLLKGLTPGQSYIYHCGSDDGWSPIFYFTAIKDGSDWSPRIAVFGDLGNKNGRSFPFLQQEVQRGNYDLTIHDGDFAYNMDTENAVVGDEFMRQMEPIAAYVPYQTAVGNHEQAYNFSNYDNRFSMIDATSGQVNNHYYSFNVGPVHFICFSTEFYFFQEYGWSQLFAQYEWLKQDLAEAAKPENRKLRPWIVTLGHRPMYCSTEDRDDCSFKESVIRKGFPVTHSLGLEDMFYKYGVDIEYWAHEHIYERMWPVYDRKVYNGSYDEPYKNPKAPVHIITGSAGMSGGVDPFVPEPPEWSAIRISDYGYTRMLVHNRTHLSIEQVSADKSGKIVDAFTIIKDFHGSYELLNVDHNDDSNEINDSERPKFKCD